MTAQKTVLSNNARIAKNTLFLYLRMLLVLIVNLFTVRIVLKALGAEDYGLFNVVGGVVTMFSFLTGTLSSASLRFFSYSLGKNDYESLKRYFTTTFWCYVVFGAIILVLAESIGLWFVQNKLTIPEGRYNAVLWVYQFAILSFIFHILSVPYNSLLISHERMHVYAYVGIVEVLLKLVIAFLLMQLSGDKLILYAILLCLSTGLITLFYVVYDRYHFKESKVSFQWNKTVFREILSYSGWSMVGAISGVCRGQGINIILNMFFGPVVNTARAVAFQIEHAISGFVTNFYNAVRPQITKYYSSGNKTEMMKLVFRSSRFSYYLMLFLSLPILYETNFVLALWLGDVPDYTLIFTRLVIIYSLFETLSHPLQTTISATGKIKWMQIVTGGLLILNLPVSWVFLKHNYPPEITMYVSIVISIIAQMVRIYFSNKLAGMPVGAYFKNVLGSVVFVTFLSLIIPMLIYLLMKPGLIRFFVLSVLSCIGSGIIILYCGMTLAERKKIFSIIKNKTNSILYKKHF